MVFPKLLVKCYLVALKRNFQSMISPSSPEKNGKAEHEKMVKMLSPSSNLNSVAFSHLELKKMGAISGRETLRVDNFDSRVDALDERPGETLRASLCAVLWKAPLPKKLMNYPGKRCGLTIWTLVLLNLKVVKCAVQRNFCLAKKYDCKVPKKSKRGRNNINASCIFCGGGGVVMVLSTFSMAS